MFFISDAQPLHPSFRLPEPLTLRCPTGSHLALIGPNGGGKTTIGRIIAGALPLRQGHQHYDCARRAVRFTAFSDAWGDTLPAAHQLRWHHGEDVHSPTAREFLAPSSTADEVARQFPTIAPFADKPVHWLSSGELRKLHLAKALRGEARLAVIDEPYIGLDASARQELTAFLARLAQRCTLVLLLADERDVPPFVGERIYIKDMRLYRQPPATPEAESSFALPTPPTKPRLTEGDEVVRLENVSVAYFGRTILKDVSWTVRRGECWALTGANGSGKSTLLSLICADNPMAYACSVRVFGQRRGHGGNIWDIKRRIGYVAPEQIRSFTASRCVCDIVASGLSDSGCLHRPARPEERTAATVWLQRLGVAHLAERDFLTLSDGEKRLTLLARAFVNEPELLILDEPFHGLDPEARQRARRLIEAYVADGRTLIIVSHYAEEYAQLTQYELKLPKA